MGMVYGEMNGLSRPSGSKEKSKIIQIKLYRTTMNGKIYKQSKERIIDRFEKKNMFLYSNRKNF